MSEINNLVYFLNSVKDTLPFKDENDFMEKIQKDKDFRIRVQKLVYLSKFFGWENPYIFTLAPRGPYSVELKQAYVENNILERFPEEINDFKIGSFIEFVHDKNLLFLEAATTILYQFDEKTDEDKFISSIESLKRHIPPNIIRNAYGSIKNFKLHKNYPAVNSAIVNRMENEVMTKIKDLTMYYENFEVSSNRIIVLGSMDYMRIALRESDLDLKDAFNLLMFIKRYLTLIDELSMRITSDDDLTYSDLSGLEEIFDQFQDFVSEEHHIIKRIDDDEFDETLCY